MFSCLFAGWGDHKETRGWLRAREDVSGVPCKFIFYEIVRKGAFSSSGHHIAAQSSTRFLLLRGL
jgi:predicted deacylase